MGKSVCLLASGSGWGTNSGLYYIDGLVRKPTRVECERLQTVPDGYTFIVSDKQARKMLGNGWTVDVIVHIFKGLLDENIQNHRSKQLSWLIHKHAQDTCQQRKDKIFQLRICRRL